MLRKKGRDRTTTLSISLPRKLLKAVDRQRDLVPRSTFIASILKKKLKIQS